MRRRTRLGYSAVLFDFGGTLDADGIAWKMRFFQLCRDEGLVDDLEQFERAFFAVDDALVAAIPSSFTFEETACRIGHGLARAFGTEHEAVGARIASRFLDDALRHLARNTPLLTRLAASYRLGIVSNFYGNLGTVCHNAGIRHLFSVITDSACVGSVKPDPRIFQSALDGLGLRPADALFVGDSLPRDMAGACAIGMRHVWLAGAAPADAEACCPDDLVIHSLEELDRLLL
jgi:FMN phosphatase YigB (HAD superfamily)